MTYLYVPALLLPSSDLILIPDNWDNKMVLYSETDTLRKFKKTHNPNFALDWAYGWMKRYHLNLVPVCVNDEMQVEWKAARDFFKSAINSWIDHALDAIEDDNPMKHQRCLKHVFEMQRYLKSTPCSD